MVKRIFFCIFTLFAFIMAVTPAVAREGMNLEWEKYFGSPKIDMAYAACQTSDGGYIVTGKSLPANNSEASYYNAALLKLDSLGLLQWQKIYGGAGDDCGSAVLQTSDGGYLIAGETPKPYSVLANTDVYLVKTDASGNKLWERNYGGDNDDTAACISKTREGDYVITGETGSPENGNVDVYLIKINKDGNKIWERAFGGPDTDSGAWVSQTGDGGYIVAGKTFSAAGGYNAYLLKTDPEGNKLWEKNYGGPGWDTAGMVEQTSDGGFIVTGQTSSFSNGNFDLYLLKTDQLGNKLWERNLVINDWSTGKWVRQTPEGEYLAAGWSTSANSPNPSFLLVRISAGGEKLKEYTLENRKFNENFPVRQTADGGFIIAGWWADTLKSSETSNDDFQYYLAKLAAKN
ncbi:hypothetical protein [Desulfocucumis palustris]|nr:hypothetical protein [Desulfocucumis palustris]